MFSAVVHAFYDTVQKLDIHTAREIKKSLNINGQPHLNRGLLDFTHLHVYIGSAIKSADFDIFHLIFKCSMYQVKEQSITRRPLPSDVTLRVLSRKLNLFVKAFRSLDRDSKLVSQANSSFCDITA